MFQAQIWLTGWPNELHLCLFAPSLQIPMVAEPITKAQVEMAECSREKAVAEAGIQTKSQRIQSPGRIQVKFRSVQVNKSWFWIISSSCISQAPVGHEVARKATWHLSHRQRSTKNGRRQSYMKLPSLYKKIPKPKATSISLFHVVMFIEWPYHAMSYHIWSTVAASVDTGLIRSACLQVR